MLSNVIVCLYKNICRKNAGKVRFLCFGKGTHRLAFVSVFTSSLFAVEDLDRFFFLEPALSLSWYCVFPGACTPNMNTRVVCSLSLEDQSGVARFRIPCC